MTYTTHPIQDAQPLPNDVPPPEAAPPQHTEPPAQAADALRDYGQLGQFPNPKGNIQFITIIGQVEGHMVQPPFHKTTKYEHIIPLLVAGAQSQEVDGLLVLLNTVGGDVEAGLAIAELIAGFGKPTVSLVVGGGHSIGVPLAVAADFSLIAPSATMTLHPVRLNGTVVGAPQTYDYFNKTQERVINFIVENSGIEPGRLRELLLDTSTLALDVGTMLIGQQAVDEGLIDAAGGLDDALERLYGLIMENKGA